MSSVFRRSDDGWQAVELPGGGVLRGSEIDRQDDFSVISFGAAAERQAALVVRPGVPARVNGRHLVGGLRVLDHQDEIRVRGESFFYSSETRPAVVPFRLGRGGSRPRCPRCRLELRDGEPSVCCPGCGRWYHEIPQREDVPAKPCFTYEGRCRLCSHPTALSGETLWRPEEAAGA